MGFLSSVSDAILAMFAGTPAGDPRLWPAESVEGRDQALRALGQYLLAVQFYRSGGVGKPAIPFHLSAFYTEQPDPEVEIKLPAISMVAGRGEFLPGNLTPEILDCTKDVYGPGTVVRWTGNEYREVVSLEVWATQKAERRAIIKGLGAVTSPLDGVYGLRFKLPNYYGATCRFTPLSRTNIEEMAIENRRRAMLEVELLVNELHLINYVTMQPVIITVDVKAPGDAFEDGSTGVEVSLDS